MTKIVVLVAVAVVALVATPFFRDTNVSRVGGGGGGGMSGWKHHWHLYWSIRSGSVNILQDASNEIYNWI